MAERIVRFSEQFFARLESLLPDERGDDGAPSLTDIMMLELPAIRDRLAADFDGVTMQTPDPDVRVHLTQGVLVRHLAVYAALDEAGSVEVFWLDIEP